MFISCEIHLCLGFYMFVFRTCSSPGICLLYTYSAITSFLQISWASGHFMAREMRIIYILLMRIVLLLLKLDHVDSLDNEY